ENRGNKQHGAQRCGAIRRQSISTTDRPIGYTGTMTPPTRCIPGFLIIDEPEPPSKPAPDHRALINNLEFLTDCARYLEGILNRQQVKKRWRNIDDAVWNLLGDDNELVDAIERTHSLRVQNGSCKRERAQLAVVKAPAVLEEILLDTKQSARHRIDSART